MSKTFAQEWAEMRTNIRIVIDWLDCDEPDIQRCIDFLKKAIK